MVAANKVIPSVQMVWLPWRSNVGISLLEMVTTQAMFSIAFVKQGDAWNITLCHGGPMKKPLNTLESIFILRKTRQRIRPDLNSPNCMETSSNFLSLNVQ